MSQKKTNCLSKKKSGQSDTHGKKICRTKKTYMNKKQIQIQKEAKSIDKEKKEERTTFIGVLDRGKK